MQKRAGKITQKHVLFPEFFGLADIIIEKNSPRVRSETDSHFSDRACRPHPSPLTIRVQTPPAQKRRAPAGVPGVRSAQAATSSVLKKGKQCNRAIVLSAYLHHFLVCCLRQQSINEKNLPGRCRCLRFRSIHPKILIGIPSQQRRNQILLLIRLQADRLWTGFSRQTIADLRICIRQIIASRCLPFVFFFFPCVLKTYLLLPISAFQTAVLHKTRYTGSFASAPSALINPPAKLCLRHFIKPWVPALHCLCSFLLCKQHAIFQNYLRPFRYCDIILQPLSRKQNKPRRINAVANTWKLHFMILRFRPFPFYSSIVQNQLFFGFSLIYDKGFVQNLPNLRHKVCKLLQHRKQAVFFK